MGRGLLKCCSNFQRFNSCDCFVCACFVFSLFSPFHEIDDYCAIEPLERNVPPYNQFQWSKITMGDELGCYCFNSG